MTLKQGGMLQAVASGRLCLAWLMSVVKPWQLFTRCMRPFSVSCGHATGPASQVRSGAAQTRIGQGSGQFIHLPLFMADQADISGCFPSSATWQDSGSLSVLSFSRANASQLKKVVKLETPAASISWLSSDAHCITTHSDRPCLTAAQGGGRSSGHTHAGLLRQVGHGVRLNHRPHSGVLARVQNAGCGGGLPGNAQHPRDGVRRGRGPLARSLLRILQGKAPPHMPMLGSIELEA